MKNILIFADGTWNKGGTDTPTNIWQLYQAIDLRSTQPKQIAFYADGVGTAGNRLVKTLGGAFGLGIGGHISELYIHLINHYTPGDKIYLFGFSRGSYTIRLLTGLIHEFGVTKRLYSNIDKAYSAIQEAYVSEKNPNAPEQLRKKLKIDLNPNSRQDPNFVPIEFCGLWETVDAVGGPCYQLAGIINRVSRNQFHRSNLKPVNNITRGYHALAIDESRAPFLPVMWDESGLPDHQTIEQVWFCGVHSNIGGGYPQPGLSLVAFEWLIEKAITSGMQISETEYSLIKSRANPHSKLYDSRAGLSVYYPLQPRNIDFFQRDHAHARTRIHDSVMERISWGTDKYAPLNLPVEFDIVSTPPAQPKFDQPAIQKALGNGKHLLKDALQNRLNQIRLQWCFLSFSFVTASTAVYYMLIDNLEMEKEKAEGVQGACYGLVDFFSSVLHEATLERVLATSCYNLELTFGAIFILAFFFGLKSIFDRKEIYLGHQLWLKVFDVRH